MSALTGLGGYVGLGGKGPSAPLGVRTVGGEVLVAREGMSPMTSAREKALMEQILGCSTLPRATSQEQSRCSGPVNQMPLVCCFSDV